MTVVDKSCGRVEASDGTSFSGRQDSQARRIIRWILFAARSSRRRRLGQPPPPPFTLKTLKMVRMLFGQAVGRVYGLVGLVVEG